MGVAGSFPVGQHGGISAGHQPSIWPHRSPQPQDGTQQRGCEGPEDGSLQMLPVPSPSQQAANQGLVPPLTPA